MRVSELMGPPWSEECFLFSSTWCPHSEGPDTVRCAGPTLFPIAPGREGRALHPGLAVRARPDPATCTVTRVGAGLHLPPPIARGLVARGRVPDVSDQPSEQPPYSPEARHLENIPSVEVISRAAVMLLSAGAERLGLADADPATSPHRDLDEARRLITALAGLVDGVRRVPGPARRAVARRAAVAAEGLPGGFGRAGRARQGTRREVHRSRLLTFHSLGPCRASQLTANMLDVSLSKVSRPLLRDEAYDRIRQAIVDGTLPPGAPLRDADLADQLGLSKAPVREALRRLADDGLVESKPQSYTRVSDVMSRDVIDARQIVRVLHEFAVREAAPRCRPADVAAMRAANDRFADSHRGAGTSRPPSKRTTNCTTSPSGWPATPPSPRPSTATPRCCAGWSTPRFSSALAWNSVERHTTAHRRARSARHRNRRLRDLDHLDRPPGGPMTLADFPRYPLLFGPSPVHPLERLTEHLGGAKVWAKREDVNSGPRVRRQQDPQARVPGRRRARARRRHARLHRRRPVQPHPAGRGRRRAGRAEGRAGAGKLGRLARPALRQGRQHPALADPRRGRPARPGRLRHRVQGGVGGRASPRSRQSGGKPYAIPAGASDHRLGGLGFANWIVELEQQEAELGVFFDTVIVCSVTGSTQGGMVAGTALGKDRARILGIDASAKPGRDPRAGHAHRAQTPRS